MHDDLFSPVTKFIISYSGGVGSAASCLLAMENGLDFEMVFADVTTEDEDLYRFNRDLERVIGKPITVLKDGRTPWGVFRDRKFIGNSRTAHCSDILKTRLVKEYIGTKYRNRHVTMILGMGLSEMDRIERAETRWHPVPVKSALVFYKLHKTADIRQKVLDYGITLPRLYDYGFPHNNCGGACVRGGLKQWASVLEYFPERFAYHEGEMNRVMAEIGDTARPFLRHQRDGKEEYLTLTEFREKYQAGHLEIDPYDYGGCSCFVD